MEQRRIEAATVKACLPEPEATIRNKALAAQEKPTLLVACRALGVASEVWLWRQLIRFGRFDTHVACWEHEHPEQYADERVLVHQVGFEFEAAERGVKRWINRVRKLPTGNLLGTTGRERQHLEQLFAAVRPEVVLCHFGHTALRVLPVARKFGIPLLAHFHGYDIMPKLRDRYYRWSLRNSLGDFGGLVVVGSHQRTVLAGLGADERKMHLIPCGAPTEEFEPRSEHAVGPCRFIAVSRMVAWKGVDLTLRAFVLALESEPGIELHLVGGGAMEGELRRLADACGVAAKVTFHGVQLVAEVRRLLRDCDVFVQHSVTHASGWVEGFGVSIAEASATGLPVVVSRSGGITDQVVDGETGRVVAERDVAGMAAAMVELARDPETRRRMGQAGRRRVVEHFDTGKQVAKLEGVLLGMLARRSCRNGGAGGRQAVGGDGQSC